MKYASTTSVSCEKSRNEIEQILARYGASTFAYMNSSAGAEIMFVSSNRKIRLRLPMPDREKFTVTDAGRRRSKPGLVQAAMEQAIRQRWRALALVVKAKLEAVESGVATFEQEFMAYTVLPEGDTVGDRIMPGIEDAYRTGKGKQLLLTAG
ncbi:MAG: hypothetical protein K8R92_00920 [Planctomycetes bacterium]|nr:hypothetical protein [Planctomycetota bacterium]